MMHINPKRERGKINEEMWYHVPLSLPGRGARGEGNFLVLNPVNTSPKVRAMSITT
jgi:hypothetical protein